MDGVRAIVKSAGVLRSIVKLLDEDRSVI